VSVKAVTLKKDEGSIEVEVACAETSGAARNADSGCMYTRGATAVRHLDSCQYKTILVADVPRVKCDQHGTQTVKLPWAEPGSRFTAGLNAWRLTSCGMLDGGGVTF